MLIFYDESGTFTSTLDKTSISLIGILIIPEDTFSKIEKKYKRIRNTLPNKNGEVKGRLLTENQVDSIVTMLAKNDVIFLVECIDMSLHTNVGIEAHKKAAEEGITANLTDKHHENIINKSRELSDRLSKMPKQLYVQSVLTFSGIYKAVELATLYYCQRRPKVLHKFEWVFDAKNKEGITDWEDWWSSTVMPVLQSKSVREPLPQFEDGDYTYFERFYSEIPEYLLPYIKDPNKKEGFDIRKIMMESFRFSSNSEMGLELVDILTNATRRALIGNLKKSGWQNIPKLMIHRTQHYINLVGLEDFKTPKTTPYIDVLNYFRKGGKDMLTRKNRS